MPRWSQPEMSPWRRRALTIPPDSRQAWVRLAVWDFWMGAIICGALALGVNVIVTDCQTPWPDEAPPFPVITIRVGDGSAPVWGNQGHNRVITIEDHG